IPVTPGHHGESDLLTFSNHASRYKVRKGDTVASVADDFGVPAEKLRKWNHLKSSSLKPGRTLMIYKPTAGGEVQTEVASKRRSTKSGKKTTVASKSRVPEDDDPAPEVAVKSKSSSHLKTVS